MIIAITNQNGGMEKSILADRLAAWRALAGRKVLLLDADPRQVSLGRRRRHAAAGAPPKLAARAVSGKGLQPELEHLSSCYHDIVIDSEGRDSMGSRAALIAARVAILAVEQGGGDAASQARLVERVATARLFNPGLRVLVIAAADEATTQEASQWERHNAQALVARIPAARLIRLSQLYGAVFNA